jgi:hypothetical protein
MGRDAPLALLSSLIAQHAAILRVSLALMASLSMAHAFLVVLATMHKAVHALSVLLHAQLARAKQAAHLACLVDTKWA